MATPEVKKFAVGRFECEGTRVYLLERKGEILTNKFIIQVQSGTVSEEATKSNRELAARIASILNEQLDREPKGSDFRQLVLSVSPGEGSEK